MSEELPGPVMFRGGVLGLGSLVEPVLPEEGMSELELPELRVS
jgi:hypothetical protein